MFSESTASKMDLLGLNTDQKKPTFFQTKLTEFVPNKFQTLEFHADVPSPLSPTERFYEMDFTDTQTKTSIRINGISEEDCKAKLAIYLYEAGHIAL